MRLKNGIELVFGCNGVAMPESGGSLVKPGFRVSLLSEKKPNA
jgi:hypothetical protein